MIVDDPDFLDEHSPHHEWVAVAVSMGFKRSIAESMTVPAIIEALNRLESSDDTAVR